MVLELYLDLYSQPCRSVYIFAKKNNIPFEFKQLSLSEGQHYSEEFGKVNPLRKVPAMKDGEYHLAESIAILLYMCQKFKTPDHWYPSDLQKQAKVDEYLSWQHAAIRAPASQIFWFKLMMPITTGNNTLQAKMDSRLEELNTSLQLFEEYFLQDKNFIVGQEISLADIVAIVELIQPLGSGLDIFEGRPKLTAWRERVKDSIGKELFDEVHELILNARDLPKKMEQSAMLPHFKAWLQKILN
ncbi:glutathione S-transferase theta-1-like [Polyodon spathula]|uniref:glutathione S-transferase theta-1-like n=1 Tax=Polyodon spathula TaxID=7913 RepID=UPI001B7F28E2|nr:glutathione S-transferase theta-1-like [Polyodon spathula]